MVGQRIRTLRTKKGISQEYLAEQLGLSQSTLARIENGQAKLAARLVPQVCTTLEVELEDIFTSVKVRNVNNTLDDQSTAHFQQLLLDQKALYEKLLAEKEHVIALLKGQHNDK